MSHDHQAVTVDPEAEEVGAALPADPLSEVLSSSANADIHGRAKRGIKPLMGRQVFLQIFAFAGGIVLARVLALAHFELYVIVSFSMATFLRVCYELCHQYVVVNLREGTRYRISTSVICVQLSGLPPIPVQFDGLMVCGAAFCQNKNKDCVKSLLFTMFLRSNAVETS